MNTRSEEKLLEQAIHEQVKLAEHDPTWPAQFELERDRLNTLLPGVFLAMEHVGSTAVHLLPAKPVIDILGAVASIAEADRVLPTLCASGYTTSAEFNASLGDRRWLMRHKDGHRTHHLHLVVLDGADWKDMIRFRDVLRNNSTIRATYLELKRGLEREYPHDREAYTKAKTEFVRAVLAQVK